MDIYTIIKTEYYSNNDCYIDDNNIVISNKKQYNDFNIDNIIYDIDYYNTYLIFFTYDRYNICDHYIKINDDEKIKKNLMTYSLKKNLIIDLILFNMYDLNDIYYLKKNNFYVNNTKELTMAYNNIVNINKIINITFDMIKKYYNNNKNKKIKFFKKIEFNYTLTDIISIICKRDIL